MKQIVIEMGSCKWDTFWSLLELSFQTHPLMAWLKLICWTRKLIIMRKVPLFTLLFILFALVLFRAALSPAETYKHIDLFKSSFEARKELNIPLILCPKPYRDVCAKCKNQIYENYFYVKANVRICRRCHKNGLESKNLSEKYSYGLFKVTLL